MILKSLIEECNYNKITGNKEVNIKYITETADEVRQSSLFVSSEDDIEIQKANIKKAVEKGAVAVLYSGGFDIDEDITVVEVENFRKAMASISIKYFNNPTFNFRLIGVAGSTGKTPTISVIEKILITKGKKVGRIDTNRNTVNSEVLVEEHLSQNSIKLQHLFHEMALVNVSDVVMEVSSRTIEVEKIYGVQYDIAVLTNIINEKLDFYKTFENYVESKKKLFKKSRMAVINLDDENSSYMLEGCDFEEVITYSTQNSEANLYASSIERVAGRLLFSLDYNGSKYRINLDESHFLSVKSDDLHNILAGIGACLLARVSMHDIIKGLKEI